MGVSVVGLVFTEDKDLWITYYALDRLLTSVINEHRKDVFDKVNQLPIFKITSNHYVRCYFTLKGEQRILSIFFACDNDYAEYYPGSKIVLSFGDWGMAEELMVKMTRAVADGLAANYVVFNDSSYRVLEEGWLQEDKVG